jgi:hypothetical protein
VCGVPTGLAHGAAWFWGPMAVGMAVVVGAVLYHRRWQRLQLEIFRKREP